MSLMGMGMQIMKYKLYIAACKIAITNLQQANNRIDDGMPNLESAKENYENGYKGGADALGSDEIKVCSTDAATQKSSVSSTITELQNAIVEFEQKIRELEAAMKAEMKSKVAKA